jgi:hypothetical protein
MVAAGQKTGRNLRETRIVQHEQYHRWIDPARRDSPPRLSQAPDNGGQGAEGQRAAGGFPEVIAGDSGGRDTKNACLSGQPCSEAVAPMWRSDMREGPVLNFKNSWLNTQRMGMLVKIYRFSSTNLAIRLLNCEIFETIFFKRDAHVGF